MPVMLVEVGTPAAQIAAQGLAGLAAERHQPFLVSLAQAAHEPLVQVDAAPVETDSLADAQAGPVQQLDKRAVAQRPGRDAVRGRTELLDVTRRKRSRKAAATRGRLQIRGRVVVAGTDQHEMPIERSGCG